MYQEINILGLTRESSETINMDLKKIMKAFESFKKQNIFSEQISNLSKQLSSLGPYQVLERGYAIPMDEYGTVIRSSKHIDLGQSFQLKMAKDRGSKTVDGLGMLIHQGIPGFEAWFGQKPLVTEELRKILIK